MPYRTPRAEVSQFAALYAERVFLLDPFEGLSVLAEEEVGEDDLYEFWYTVSQLLMLRPLIEAGLVAFASSKHYGLCRGCWTHLFQEEPEHLQQRAESLEDFLKTELKKRVTFTATFRSSGWFIQPSGVDDFLVDSHAGVGLYDEPRFLKRSRDKGSVVLSGRQVQSLRLVDGYVTRILEDRCPPPPSHPLAERVSLFLPRQGARREDASG